MKRRFDTLAMAFFICMLVAGESTMVRTGTTGGLSGSALTTAGAPVGGAKIIAASPSQVVSTRTDTSGRFAFLNRAPDTYTAAVQKEGLTSALPTRASVTADTNSTIGIRPQSVTTIWVA